MNNKIFVTQPYLPPLEEFEDLLKKIWSNKWLTNEGPLHQQFENELKEFLDVPYISLFTNGTLALVVALQCLRITGEVITTPYSFVATTHSLWWNGIKPIFADVDPIFGNLDPNKVESAITPKTTAILPVHVYGIPSKVDEFQRIAEIYGLKLIYDAAHAFHVKYNNTSILNYGDLSILSFHATKSFNTFEGGAIICQDRKTKQRIDYLKNFGFANETTVIGPGINAKMSEIQAAMGILQLKYFKTLLSKRQKIYEKYKEELKNIKGIRIISPDNSTDYNYSYFPIFIEEKLFGVSRDILFEKLLNEDIIARRYFYPLISNFSTYNGLDSSSPSNLPIANKLSEKVICLPIYPELNEKDIFRISNIIKENYKCE